ncbi:MAG: metallophosphoesterase [Deltaproteobacteria bacterium]|nr:metallophosphoesterase [Deltaproteobacteria bacterium]
MTAIATRGLKLFAVVFAHAVLLAACGSGGTQGGDMDASGKPDASGGSDADTDSDADSDTDGDADADSDADTTPDAGPDGGSDADAADGSDTSDTDTGDEVNLPPDGTLLARPYLMWATDSAVSVRFETAAPSVGTVRYGADAALTDKLSEDAPVMVHELRVEGLAPDTWHSYQVSFDGWVLPVESFVTAPTPGTEGAVDFVVFSDNQGGSSVFGQIVGLMDDEAPSFAVSAGDVVEEGTRANYRNQLFSRLEGFAGHVPFLVAGGNHERYLNPGASLFDEYLSQPGDEHCFPWQWGALFFVFIDSDLPIGDGTPQHDCIAQAFGSDEAAAADFRIAVFHKPPRIEWWVGGAVAFTQDMEAPWIRGQLEPLLESLGVDLVFNGHNHLYAYTPQTPGGITFVTAGGAGGALDTELALWRVGTWPEIETTLHQHHFLSVHATPGALDVTAIGLDGTVIHQFSL